MLHTTKGIVLHHFKYSEKSVIAKVYTEKFGLQSYIVKGVRSKKSKNKLAYLQVLSIVEINAFHKENKTLHQLKSIKLEHTFQSIPFNIHKSSIAFFIADVLKKSIKEEEKNSSLFDFLLHAIQILDLQESNYANFHLVFLSQLSRYLGFYPNTSPTKDFKNCYFDLQEGFFTKLSPPHQAVIEPPLSALFATILGTNFDAITELKITAEERKLLLNSIISYYELHLSNFGTLKSKEILEEILN
jgi:DNA repair protein RecO (recombination protein O)